jgi:replicative DNA helicase
MKSSKQAESTLLAIIIQGGQQGIGNQLLSEAEESGVTAECFTDHHCQTLWEVCKDVESKGRQVEETEILTSAQVKGVELVDFLNIMEFVKSPMNLQTYSEKVLEFHKLRMLNRMSRLVQEQVGEGIDAAEIMSVVDSTTKKLAETGSTNKSISDAVDDFIKDFFGDFDQTAYVPTGVGKYDESLSRGGFGPSQLCVFAARPGCGKTAMALNIIRTASNKGVPIGMFSLEMDVDKLMGRLVSMESGVPWDRYKDGQGCQKKLKVASETVKKWPLQICDDAYNLPLILAIARNWKRRHGVKAIVIDYCQLIRGNSRLPREQQVAEISRECKLLAKQLRIPVILLAQINRESEKEDREPRMSDLRESGALEQDADSITFLYLKGSDDKTGPMVRWVRPKQRDGIGYDAGSMQFIRQTGVMEDI